MKFSLILATVNRVAEIELFFESLMVSTYKDFEVIVVDQNEDLKIDGLCDRFSNFLNIVHLRPGFVGLSKARNFGLKHITGDFVCFPDDDCKFYPDTLVSVMHTFLHNDKFDSVVGRIYDFDLNLNVIKNWPSRSLFLNKLNFYFLSSSVTLFIKRGVLNNAFGFDEQLGAGEVLGSCEDPDFIYRLLCLNYTIYYNPSVSVWHPIPKTLDISNHKVFSYAAGFGGFIRKDFSFVKFFLFVGVFTKKISQFILRKKDFRKGYFTHFFKGLFFGITSYGNKSE